MIKQSFLKYLKDFILKSGEELEWNSLDNDHLLTEVKIIKRSVRTYRILGVLTLSLQTAAAEEILNDSKLKALAFTTRKRVLLDDLDSQTFKWLEEGWIIKEVRFEKDEKTVHSTYYRMGFRLYQHEQLISQQKKARNRNEFLLIKNQILSTLTTLAKDNQNFIEQRELGMQGIIKIVTNLNVNDLSFSTYFPQNWSPGKRLKFLHFVNAFSQLCIRKEEFDWKEIGATYFQEIGGSKEFDSYKEEFIAQLEVWTNVQADELGLISLGQITPIFFAGQMSGNYATYAWGPVHASTNLSISNEAYRTKATTLWLVENRAILTRMAATGHFLKETESLIIGVDGHLRTAHRKVITQILENSHIKQVLIWCDYDPDGLLISKGLYTTVNQHNGLTIKWILPDQRVINNWQQYEQHVANYLENNKMEQEQSMGDVEQWKKWILG